MSETSTLISYSGRVTRAELAQLPTPPATPTHIPIPHVEVVEALIGTLRLRHIGAVSEEFAVSRDGMEMFGVLDHGPDVTKARSEEHTSELQSHLNIVCRLLLEKKKSNS